MVEATQKTGAGRVAVTSLAQLIALQARHDRRFALAARGLTTAVDPANERRVAVSQEWRDERKADRYVGRVESAIVM